MAVMTLVALGLVMVYSASAITAQEKLGDGFYYLKRQAAAAGLGLLAMTLALRIGYRRLARLVYPLLVCVLVLLVVVLLPAVGTTVGGARRWIRLLGFSIQPAEIAKLAWVLYLAYSLAKKRERVALFSVGFLPHLLMAGVLVALCMAEPDFGSSGRSYFCSSFCSLRREPGCPIWSDRCYWQCQSPTGRLRHLPIGKREFSRSWTRGRTATMPDIRSPSP